MIAWYYQFLHKFGECPLHRCYCHCAIFVKENPSSSVSAKSWTMIEATKVFLKKGVCKFIKYCGRDTKNLTKFSKKNTCEEVRNLPFDLFFYQWILQYICRLPYLLKKSLADFTYFQERLPEAVAWMCSISMNFLKNSQISQEKIWAKVFFLNKVAW